MKFRLKESDNQGNKIGLHRIGNLRYHAGDVLETDLPMDEMFRNKFERVPDNTPVSEPEIVNKGGLIRPRIPQSQISQHEDEAEVETTTDQKTSASSNKYGKDVTTNFPNAHLMSVSVFFNETSKKYTIVDNEDTDYVIKTSKSANNIKLFLKKQVG